MTASNAAATAGSAGRLALGCALLLVTADRCAAPTSAECVRPDVPSRLVRLHFRAGTCTGVLVSRRLIRTAGHCFHYGGAPTQVETIDRRPLRAKYSWAFAFTEDRASEIDFDQAELVADRDLNDQPAIPILSPWDIDPTAEFTTAGFPADGDLRVHEARVWFTLLDGWSRMTRASIVLYTADHSSASHGESGGAIFDTGNCRLSLVGVLTAQAAEWTRGQNAAPLDAMPAIRGAFSNLDDRFDPMSSDTIQPHDLPPDR